VRQNRPDFYRICPTAHRAVPNITRIKPAFEQAPARWLAQDTYQSGYEGLYIPR
jgi:hypothetical protein